MSIMRILILVIAGGAALVAAMLVRGMGSNDAPQLAELVETEQEPAVPLAQVLVAVADMPVGYRIAPEDLTWQDWPENLLTENYFQSELTPDATTELAGSIVRTPIYAGEPILDPKIIQQGETGILAAVIAEGMRGIAVEISVEISVGRSVGP